MKDYIDNVDMVYKYYKKKATELFNEWLSATDRDVPDQFLDHIWTNYRHLEGKAEGVYTALKIAEQFEAQEKKQVTQ